MPIFNRNNQPAAAATAAPAAADGSPEKPGTDSETKWFNKRPGPLSFAGLSKLASSEKTPSTPPATSARQAAFPFPHTAADGPGRVDAPRLSQFSLSLNDLVNKAFIASNTSSSTQAPLSWTSPFSGASISTPRLQNITYGNNRLPDRVKVIEMTRLFIQELQTAAAVDPYLLRAVSRAILKSISQFVTRIESLLVPASRDPGALVIPASVKAAQHLPAAMEFNLALMSLEWIVEESLERCLNGLPPLALLNSPNIMVPTSSEGEAALPMPQYVHEILSPLREQMEASIIHVVQPVLVQVKSSLAACIARANPHPFQPQGRNEAEREGAGDFGARIQSGTPWLKELEERLDAAYRLLFLRISERCGQDGQAWFISVAIHIIWKGLVAITSRSVFAPASVVEEQFAHTFGRTSGTTPSSVVLNSLLSGDFSHSRRVPTPTQLAHALRSVGKPGAHRLRRAPGESSTGSHTPIEGANDLGFDGWKSHFTLPTDADCYVIHPLLVAEQLHDLQMFERLMVQFTADLVVPPQARKKRRSASRQRQSSGDSESSVEARAAMLDADAAQRAAGALSDEPEAMPSPHDDEDLARAALKEALAALQSTVVVLRTLLQEPDTLQFFAMRSRAPVESTEQFLSPTASHAFNVIPELLLIHIAFCRIPPGWTKRDEAKDDGDAARADLLPTPPQLFGYSWTDYDAALTGFAAGEAAASSLARLYQPVIGQVYRTLDDRCGDACDHALRPDREANDDDVCSEHSDVSDADMAGMTQSAPALENLSLQDRGRTVRQVSGGAAAHMDLGGTVRSRSVHRTGGAGRFWRKSPSQNNSTLSFHLPNALPPRVSRANATSSPYRALSRSRRGSPVQQSSSPSLPRSTTHTLAHMQRNALNMFDSVLLRVGQTYRSVSP